MISNDDTSHEIEECLVKTINRRILLAVSLAIIRAKPEKTSYSEYCKELKEETLKTLRTNDPHGLLIQYQKQSILNCIRDLIPITSSITIDNDSQAIHSQPEPSSQYDSGFQSGKHNEMQDEDPKPLEVLEEFDDNTSFSFMNDSPPDLASTLFKTRTSEIKSHVEFLKRILHLKALLKKNADIPTNSLVDLVCPNIASINTQYGNIASTNNVFGNIASINTQNENIAHTNTQNIASTNNVFGNIPITNFQNGNILSTNTLYGNIASTNTQNTGSTNTLFRNSTSTNFQNGNFASTNNSPCENIAPQLRDGNLCAATPYSSVASQVVEYKLQQVNSDLMMDTLFTQVLEFLEDNVFCRINENRELLFEYRGSDLEMYIDSFLELPPLTPKHYQNKLYQFLLKQTKHFFLDSEVKTQREVLEQLAHLFCKLCNTKLVLINMVQFILSSLLVLAETVQSLPCPDYMSSPPHTHLLGKLHNTPYLLSMARECLVKLDAMGLQESGGKMGSGIDKKMGIKMGRDLDREIGIKMGRDLDTQIGSKMGSGIDKKMGIKMGNDLDRDTKIASKMGKVLGNTENIASKMGKFSSDNENNGGSKMRKSLGDTERNGKMGKVFKLWHRRHNKAIKCLNKYFFLYVIESEGLFDSGRKPLIVPKL
ncbi:hypothetical protein M8J77_014168 [Diaphorina citri]|nr:hypothetical protein M8J77_014168 [Diaphorina citri]